jgi:anti-anti-sigma regulatory factor
MQGHVFMQSSEEVALPDRIVNCPETLVGEHVAGFLDALRSALISGKPVSIDASPIAQVSTLALQVIAAARKSAVSRSIPFRLFNGSPEFVRACRDAGLDQHLELQG